jgi:SAM-dependent methyltransferase
MGATMSSQHELLARESRRFFEERWREGDPWEVESSGLDQASYESQATLLGDRAYGKALELGCGSGAFTRRLAEIAHRTVAVDVAPSAIERARAAGLDPKTVDFSVANIMDLDLRSEGPWDLVVMSETIYYLGWLYPLFDVGWLATEIFGATREGGRFLMANTYGGEKDYLLRPWLIDTYRNLFLNVGYDLEAEEIVTGAKNRVEYEVLVALFSKPAQQSA